jgi:hypothetical protein
VGVGSDSQFDYGKSTACVFQSSHGAIVRGKNSHSIVVGCGTDGGINGNKVAKYDAVFGLV